MYLTPVQISLRFLCTFQKIFDFLCNAYIHYRYTPPILANDYTMCIFRIKNLCIGPESSQPGGSPASMGKSGKPEPNSYHLLMQDIIGIMLIIITEQPASQDQDHLLSRTRAAASLRQLRTGNPKSSQARSSPAGQPPCHNNNQYQ